MSAITALMSKSGEIYAKLGQTNRLLLSALGLSQSCLVNSLNTQQPG